MKKGSTQRVGVVGLDLGDRWGEYCALGWEGEVVERGRVRMVRETLVKRFALWGRVRVVMEVGTHSPWVSRALCGLGQEVIVANARQVALIARGARKSDRVDAETLARLGRVDVSLLRPIRHRGEAAQQERSLLRSRDALVRARAQLINSVRGTVKAWGERLPACSAPAFARRAAERVPEPLRRALSPLLEAIAELSVRIRALEREVESQVEQRQGELGAMRQVQGVGALTVLAFAATVEDPSRFAKSREVGPYLGLVPRRHQSGAKDPELPISKQGDAYLRRLLVSSAHYILGPFGPDSDLRRYGQRLIARGGKGAKKKAVVAVARKLAVLLHHLWVTGEIYEPLYRQGGARAA